MFEIRHLQPQNYRPLRSYRARGVDPGFGTISILHRALFSKNCLKTKSQKFVSQSLRKYYLLSLGCYFRYQRPTFIRHYFIRIYWTYCNLRLVKQFLATLKFCIKKIVLSLIPLTLMMSARGSNNSMKICRVIQIIESNQKKKNDQCALKLSKLHYLERNYLQVCLFVY